MQPTALILVVDDTPANLEVISEALTHAGYEVSTAISGDRALQQLQHTLPDLSALPDLILLDVMMPGINGFETCQQIKENPAICDIPVIFMTALAESDSKLKGLSLGAVDYITKPFQEAEMIARIKLHLQLRFLTKHLEETVAARTAALSQALSDLQASQIQLVQTEKMSALGQLIAGVAHEINNPIGFVGGNLNHANAYLKELLTLIELYQQHCPPLPEIQAAIAAIDLDHIKTDFPKLLTSMKEGVDRIRSISTSLRTFSRADCEHPIPFDLQVGLDSTLTILKYRLQANEQRPAIVIEKHYGDLPPIECFPGQLSQVFMNLLANAIDAVEATNPGRSLSDLLAQPNRITLRTALSADGKQAIIQIQDNGIGMSELVQQKIFDYLFTTKSVGQGTGLGLSIVRQIIVEKHGGTLNVTSAVGQGSEFAIALPMRQPVQQSAQRLYSTEGV
jgi:signal transduction histidine kinase